MATVPFSILALVKPDSLHIGYGSFLGPYVASAIDANFASITGGGGGGGVTSVNGLTGVVVLTKTNIGLGNVDNLSAASILAGLTSGNVISALTYTPANAAALGTAAAGTIGVAAGDVVALDGFAKLPAVDGSQLTNLPSAPVSSVNTKTGAVVLAASDLGATTIGAALFTAASAAAGRTTLGSTTVGDALFITSSAAAARTTLGLGSAALATTGVAPFNAVVLDASSKLPAVDGSQLTNLPGGGGGPVLLATLTASTSATLSDTTHITATYDHYEIVFDQIIAASASVHLETQLTVNNGSSWLATNYLNPETSITTYISLLDASTTLEPAVLNGIGISGVLHLIGPNSTTARGCSVTGQLLVPAASSNISAFMAGNNTNTSTVNGIRFLFSAGNITSGSIKIYGVP